MKKIYLLIFLIVIGLSQNQSVKANTVRAINAANKAVALRGPAGAFKTASVATIAKKEGKKIAPKLAFAPAITFAALGTKPFSNTDLALAATSTATVTTPITYTSSNPAVATIVNVLGFGAPNGGANYINGTYVNVPLTGGSGTGELATVVVANNVVTTVTPSLPSGSNYVVGDVLSCAASSVGGNGSGFNIVVATVASYIHYVSAPAPPNNYTIITASQGGGTLGNATLPPDVTATLVVTAPVITFPTLGTKPYSSQDIAVGASSAVTNKIVTYTSSNPAVATINNIVTGTIAGGTGYTGGTFYKVPITGGSGTGATATITTSSSAVTAVTITANGAAFNIGDVLTAAPSSIGGTGSGFTYTVTGYTSNIHFNPTVPAAPNNTTVITASQGAGATGVAAGYINAFNIATAGTGYTNGTYNSVALTGGSGTGATATIIVVGGVVNTISVSNGGSGYTAGNVLTCPAASIGGTGAGFTLSVLNTEAMAADVAQTLTVTQPAINFPALGTKQFTSNDLNPGATGVQFTTSSIATLGTPTPGTGYTNGNYYAVALTGGSGTGATATITVIGGVITSVVPVSEGANYLVGDYLTAPASSLGGTGSGFQIQVTAISTGYPVTYTSSNPAVATIVSDYIHFIGVGTTIITASQNGPANANTSGIILPPSVQQTLTVTAPTITFPAIATRSLSSTDVNPAATSTITNLPINYSSSNTAVATINNNGISTLNNLIKGTGYAVSGGVYANVPLTGGSGTGATASILVNVLSQTVVSGVVVSTVNGIAVVTITSNGSGYKVGDVLTCDPNSVGGSGSGFSITVASISSYIHFTGSGTTNITATQGGGASGTNNLPADVTQTLTVTPPLITFPALGNQLISANDLNPGATSTLASTPISYTISGTNSASVASIYTNSITSFNYIAGGSGYAINTYSPVPLTGGSGTGAVAQIAVVGGAVSIVNIISGGTGYKVNDILSASAALIGGGTTGKGFSIIVGSVGGALHYIGVPNATAATITVTASQGGGASGTASLPADVSQNLIVSPYTIVFPTTLGTKQFTSTDYAPNATSTLSTVPITLTSSNAAVATIVAGNIHFIGAGTTTITATQGGGTTGTATLPKDVSQTLTVTVPTITFPAFATVTMPSNDITLNASSPLTTVPITYSIPSTSSAVATIVNNAVHIVGPGTATVTASQGGGVGTTGLPADVTQNITIVAGAITMPTIGTKTYSDVDFNPGATGPAGIPIVYTSSNASVATIKTYTSFTTPITGGTGYVNGTYTSVALLVNGAATTPASTGTIVVNGGMVTSINQTAGPTPATGAVVTCAASSIGGSGSGFSATVNGTASLVHYNPAFPAAPGNTTTITAAAAAGITGITPATQTLTLTAPAINFPALATVSTFSNADIAPGASSLVTGIPITYTSSNPAVATIVNGQIHLIGGTGTSTITATQGGGTTGAAGIPADVTQTLTVTAGPAITFAATSSVAFGSTDITPAATSTYTNAAITYTSSNTSIATITASGTIHLVSGPVPPATSTTVSITATQGGGASGTGTLPADKVQVLTIAPAAITFATISKPFGDVDFAPGATSTVTSIPIMYISNNTAIATITPAGNIHMVSGPVPPATSTTFTITASQGGGATGTATLPADVTQTITITSPTITFAALGSKPYAANDLGLTATSTLTGTAITYTSSNTAVATIVNNSIHYVGLGTTNITASQGGGSNGTSTLPKDVIQGLTVTTPVITFAALGSKSFSTTDLALTATSTLSINSPITYTSSNTAVATIVNNAIHYTGAGTTTITASQAAYGASGTPVSVAQVLTVTPGVITFSPALGSKAINSGDLTLAATSTLSTTTYPITYTTSDPTVATIVLVVAPTYVLHYIGPGTCTVSAIQTIPGNPSYAPVPATASLTVTAATVAAVAVPTLSFTAVGSKPFSNSGDYALTATASNAAAVTFTSSNPAVGTIVNGALHPTPPSIINGVVTYPVPNTTVLTASIGGGPTGIPGQLPADASQTVTITPAVITFPTPLLGKQVFNTDDLAPGATSTFQVLSATNTALPITYTSSNPAVATIVNGNIHFTGLGSTIITASLGNVIVPDVSQTMVVTAPVLSFPTATRTLVYSPIPVPNNATSTIGNGANMPPITYTSSNTNVISISNGNIQMVGVGTATITASQAAYVNSPINLPAPQSATQVVTVTGTGTLTFPLTRTAAFTLTDQDPGATSTITSVPIIYTSSNPALVSIVNNKLHFNSLQAGVSQPNIVNITATQAASAGVPVQVITQALTVTQAIIVQNPLNKYYGDADFSPAVSTLGSGYPVLYASATITVATTETNGITPANFSATSTGQLIHVLAVGSSVITASQPGDAVNAAAANTTFTLNVLQAPLTITPKNITATYGTTSIAFPLAYDGFKNASGGFPLDDSTKFTTQPVVNITGKTPNGNYSTLPVGTYQLTASGAVSTLYTFTYGTGTLTIAAAPQTLTWTGATTITKAFTDVDFDPLARSTGDPIVYTSSNTAVATIVNGLVHITGVGTATITATLTPTSGNYSGSATLTKTLTVGPGTQTITVATIPSLSTGSAAYIPNATASSGLAVTMVATDPTIVKVVGNTLVPLHVGTTTVTFSQPGNANYSAAANVVQYVQVVDATGKLVKVDQAVSPNGDGINDFLYVEGLQNYPSNHVKIINRNGDNVYEVDGYNNKDIAFTGKSSHNGRQLPEGTYFYIIDFNIAGVNNHITGYFVLKY